MTFAGRTVVITGVGRAGQVGDQLAHAFAREGAALALIGRNPKELEARAATLDNASVTSVAADLTDSSATNRSAERVGEFAASHGGVHALVHAAGGFGSGGVVAESDEKIWHEQIAINLTTAYVASRAFLPLLRETRGSVVFFSSAAAIPGAKIAGISGYAAAKSGVITLMRAIAQEEQKLGVRANAVAPTSIRTPENEASMGRDARYVEPDELARVVLFLCSSDASAITGQVLALG